VSEGFEQQESATAPVGAGVDDLSAQTFDHRVDRFRLPTLSVTAFVQMAFQRKKGSRGKRGQEEKGVEEKGVRTIFFSARRTFLVDRADES